MTCRALLRKHVGLLGMPQLIVVRSRGGLGAPQLTLSNNTRGLLVEILPSRHAQAMCGDPNSRAAHSKSPNATSRYVKRSLCRRSERYGVTHG